jgi:hypothetical protein
VCPAPCFEAFVAVVNKLQHGKHVDPWHMHTLVSLSSAYHGDTQCLLHRTVA